MLTIKDETRFRHLAACIVTAAQHLQVDEKPREQDIANIRDWADAMLYLYQKGASRLPAKKSGKRATPDKPLKELNH